MMSEEYDEKDGRRLWLSRSDLEQLLDVVDDPTRQVAIRLGAECGLRSHEVVDVRPRNVVDTEAGTMLVVEHGKDTTGGDGKLRETPIPDSLADVIKFAGSSDPDVPVVDVSTRSLRNWIQDAREQLLEETDEVRWQYLGFHDLRRTWAGALANADVDESVALRWGGWNDLETFLEHYRGEASVEAQNRERGKVDWL